MQILEFRWESLHLEKRALSQVCLQGLYEGAAGYVTKQVVRAPVVLNGAASVDAWSISAQILDSCMMWVLDLRRLFDN